MVSGGLRRILGLVYGRELLSYDFGPTHVMNSARLESFFKAFESSGLVSDSRVLLIKPRMATIE
ncbi:MAG: hypothetical protein N3F08_05785, partial [Crenarchaeota archaeon]|nr:hypothetical protein [Thermoproteota archaeon]